jgi:hypothetical protein
VSTHKPKIDLSLDDKVEDTGDIEVPMNVETASAPLNLVPPDPNATGPWIEYTGIATVRIINGLDWKAIGIDSDLYCEWNYLNAKKLPKSMFNPEQLNYLLSTDGRFKLVEDESESGTTE